MRPSLSLAEREREYSPSSCIGGNYAPYLKAYAERSAAAAACRFERDLAYGERPSNRLDLCVPAGAQAAPLLVFIHGGYWQQLSKDSSLFAAPDCLAAGWAFAAIDYTLAPVATIAQMALECRQALRWLHASADRLGFDARRIVVAGSSAGAHLAAMAGLRGWAGDADLPAGLPAAAVLVSGIYELAPLIGTSIDTPLALTSASAGEVSPQLQSLAGFPPAVVCWGEIETAQFQRQSRDFAAAVAGAGAPRPRLFEVPGRNHFDVILELATPGTPLGDATHALMHQESTTP
ncbi:MAG: Arylformamidase [Ramlibacter sp.]|uniref:alpha/beta hydrolase n=1 Tax=Ramlibacter sp. TaxID=1917967 RepID=UPI0026366C18|nr:alpha/beta hydrolase [Ramlibacter sp.]MDB5751585.1 Arylformamidase [Ramlibacter sp.]